MKIRKAGWSLVSIVWRTSGSCIMPGTGFGPWRVRYLWCTSRLRTGCQESKYV